MALRPCSSAGLPDHARASGASDGGFRGGVPALLGGGPLISRTMNAIEYAPKIVSAAVSPSGRPTDDAGDDDRAGQQPDPPEGLEQVDPSWARGSRSFAASDGDQWTTRCPIHPRRRAHRVPNARTPTAISGDRDDDHGDTRARSVGASAPPQACSAGAGAEAVRARTQAIPVWSGRVEPTAEGADASR